jgi:hypothetical protein
MKKSKLRRFEYYKLLKCPLEKKKKTDESKDQNGAALGKIRVSHTYQNGTVLVSYRN